MPDFDPYDIDTVRHRLHGALADRLGHGVQVGPLTRYTVGFSWITYGFQAAWPGLPAPRPLILRIGPPNGIFGPYRALPEFVTMQRLHGTGVPVPQALWADDGTDVFGAPWIISAKVAGEAPIPWTADGGPAFAEPLRQTLASQFLDALGALHGQDWQTGGLAAVLPGSQDPAQAALHEIDFWVSRMHDWSPRRWPMLEWAARRFAATAPRSDRISIVHGDYRIGNFLMQDDSITAILDWELVHLGDPLEDLGWIAMQAWRGRSPWLCHLLTRDDLLAGYAARTGLTVTPQQLAWWEAFGCFKLAIMHLGAAHCYETRGFNDLRMAGMGAQIPRVILQVEAALERAA